MMQMHTILLRIRSHRDLDPILLQLLLHPMWITHIHMYLQCTLLLIKQKRLRETIRITPKLPILHNMVLQAIVLLLLHLNQINLILRIRTVLVLLIQDMITQHIQSHKLLHGDTHHQLNTTPIHDTIIAVILLQLLRTTNILHVQNPTQMFVVVNLVRHLVSPDLTFHQIPRCRHPNPLIPKTHAIVVHLLIAARTLVTDHLHIVALHLVAQVLTMIHPNVNESVLHLVITTLLRVIVHIIIHVLNPVLLLP